MTDPTRGQTPASPAPFMEGGRASIAATDDDAAFIGPNELDESGVLRAPAPVLAPSTVAGEPAAPTS